MKKYLILADGNCIHTQKWVKGLINYFDIYLISFNGVSNEISNLLPRKNIISFKLNINSGGNNFFLLKFLPKIIAILNTIKPDYVNAHYITSYGTIAVLATLFYKRKYTLILSAWGTDILVTPYKNKIYYYLTKYVLNKANFVTSDSFYMSTHIKKISSKKVILTFPFGVKELPMMCQGEKNYNIFFSNRGLDKNYNIDKIIEAFKRIKNENNNAKLYIAATGKEESTLKNLVSKLELDNSVKFLGWLNRSEMEMYYKISGFYFTLPTSDSTSVSLLEAMSYGCIPIVSNIPANLEWIKDGENGFVYEKNKKFEILPNAFSMNRKIIKEKALWNVNIKNFVNDIL